MGNTQPQNPIPSIDDMTVANYDINAKIYPMMCVIENALLFRKNPNIPDPETPEPMETDEPKEDTESPSETKKDNTAKFVYPLHNKGQMTSFVASIIPTDPSLTDEQRVNLTTIIEAKIKEIDAAKEEFEEAKKEGKSTVFTRYDQHATDTFICELGAIPDDHIVKCTFSYHMQLNKLDLLKARTDLPNGIGLNTLELSIPMVMKKRYENGGKQPELNTAPAQNFDISFTLDAPNAINILGKSSTDGDNWNTRGVEQIQSQPGKWEITNLNNGQGPQDIELYIQLRTQEFDGGVFSSAFEYKKDTKEAIFAFNLKPITKDLELIEPGQKEYQFLIDRSGSMSGSFMEQAKNALIFLLKQLPSDDTKFNITSFGSRYDRLWDTAQPYDEDNLATALRHVQKMTANYGGTEVLNPIRDIVNQECECVRDIIVLTDGGVSNTDSVIQLCGANRNMNRVWGLGIGQGCSTALVDGIAKATDADSIYVKDGDRMNAKVMQLARYTIQPKLNLRGVKFPELPDSIKVTGIDQGSKMPIYQTKWMFLKLSNLNQKSFEKLKTQQLFVDLELEAGSAQIVERQQCVPHEPTNSGLYAYWAAQKINELEYSQRRQDENVKKEIIKLSIAANVLTNYTAFIGVSNVPHQLHATNCNYNIPSEEIVDANPVPKGISAGRSYSGRLSGSPSGGFSMPMAGAMPRAPKAGGMRTKSCAPKTNQMQTKCFGSSGGYIETPEPMAGGMQFGMKKQKQRSQTPSPEPIHLSGGTIDNKTAHEVLVKISKLAGYWEDCDTVWECVKAYDNRLKKSDIIKLQGEMKMEQFLTIVVIYALQTFEKNHVDEWSLMKNKSLKYLRKSGVTEEIRNNLHLQLSQLISC